MNCDDWVEMATATSTKTEGRQRGHATLMEAICWGKSESLLHDPFKWQCGVGRPVSENKQQGQKLWPCITKPNRP